jgi:ribosomal protein S18 acetylase RimI-like enzyme
MIRTIEELSLNAWPALQTILVDGWVLRFAGGYTRRANSVNPLYPSQDDLAGKVARCERLYRDRGLPVVFKLTAESCPPELDACLAERGYALDALTSVQRVDYLPPNPLPAREGAPDSQRPAGEWVPDSRLPWEAKGARGVRFPDEGDVELTEEVTEEWFDAFCRASNLASQRRPIAWQMLHAIVSATAFAAIRHEDEVISCGFAVAQDGYVGFYDIVTDPRYRRRGLGEQLMAGLMRWGQAQGATTAYLQVMMNNPPALALYAKLGFDEAYRYWYRVKA